MDLRNRTCCFTGYRVILPGEEAKIITKIRYQVGLLMEQGVMYFGVGGGIGFDMLAAEYLIEMRRKWRKKIKIISVLPFAGWMEKWSEADKLRERAILNQCDKIVFVQWDYTDTAYFYRNRRLVDASAYCIAYCNRDRGGAAYTVRYAKKKGIRIYNACSYDLRQI